MHDASPIAPVLSSAFADDHGAHAPLICFSHLRWDFVLQRPQHLMGRFARTRRVLMWEEAIPTTHHLPYLEFHAFEGTTVQSIRPRVPDRWSREEQEAGLARLRTLSPGLRATGLSATVEDPAALARFMGGAQVIHADPGPDPDIGMLATSRAAPWSGGGGHYAVPDVLDAIRGANTTIVFINTRAQAELFFQAVWAANDDNLPIGLHHGSLSREARGRDEAAMAAGELRAVIATGSLDRGIDWGNVDLVIQVGAPRNVKRLVQRIGRANHRYNAPSRARIVPANRFEVIECVAALEAVRERDLDGDDRDDDDVVDAKDDFEDRQGREGDVSLRI